MGAHSGGCTLAAGLLLGSIPLLRTTAPGRQPSPAAPGLAAPAPSPCILTPQWRWLPALASPRMLRHPRWFPSALPSPPPLTPPQTPQSPLWDVSLCLLPRPRQKMSSQ